MPSVNSRNMAKSNNKRVIVVHITQYLIVPQYIQFQLLNTLNMWSKTNILSDERKRKSENLSKFIFDFPRNNCAYENCDYFGILQVSKIPNQIHSYACSSSNVLQYSLKLLIIHEFQWKTAPTFRFRTLLCLDILTILYFLYLDFNINFIIV